MFLLGGLGFAGFAVTGLVQWLPSYFARSFTLPITEIGASFGLIYGAGAMEGILLGELISGTLFERDHRWATWLDAAADIADLSVLTLAIFNTSINTASKKE